MRMMPCESVPRRLAQTSILAHSSACSLARPTAEKIAATKADSSALPMRTDSWAMVYLLFISLARCLSFVIAGLDPAIQLLAKRMDARVKPGHDAERVCVHFICGI